MKNLYIKWSSHYQMWKLIPSKSFRKKVSFPCPNCGELKIRSRFYLWKNPSRRNINFDLIYDYDKREAKFDNWVCIKCGNILKYESFPDVTKNFFTNLLIREINNIYFKPKLLTLRIKSGKEISGKALETGATYKADNKSIDYICGNCGKKNRFGFIKSSNPNVLQCLKCGHVNIYRPDLTQLDKTSKGN